MLRAALIATIFALTFAQPNFAQDEGGEQDHSQNQVENDNYQGQDGDAQGENADAPPVSSASGGDGGGTGSAAVPSSVFVLTPDEVQTSISTGEALPLATIARPLTQLSRTIVDASLLRMDGSLVYAMKTLSPSGELHIEYYDARTAAFIRSQ